MRTIIWFIYFWGYMVVHYFEMRRGLKALEKGDFATSDAIAEKHVPRWCNKLVKLAGVTITTIGQENIPQDRPCVFVANHRSMYDIPVMLTQLGRPHPLVSKIETLKIPLIRRWMQMLHCVFLDRDNPRQGIKCLAEATDLVKQGYSVGIFPEGTRFKGPEGEMGSFMSGGFRIAHKSGAPIVPVVLYNTRACLEGDGHFTMKPAHITVHILPPIETKGLSPADIKALPDVVEKIIREELRRGA